MPRCAGSNKDGKRCSLITTGEFCHHHLPSKGKEGFEASITMEVPRDPVDAVIDSEIELVKSKIRDLKEELKMLRNIKKSQNTKILTKARWLFYHENKGNKEMRTEITGKLVASSLAFTYKNSTEIKIPYMLIKAYTDNVFYRMSEDDRKPYVEEARELILESIHG